MQYSGPTAREICFSRIQETGVEDGDRDKVRGDRRVGSRELTDGTDERAWAVCCGCEH